MAPSGRVPERTTTVADVRALGVRLKFDSGYTDDCSVSYILTSWYSDNNAKVVLGTKGSAACKGYHYHRLSNGYTHYNYTYPCSPYPC